jgi:FixJ family two-component response regulator
VNNKTPLIAIVDDDPDVRRALRRLLESAGFAVETFASGGEFVRSFECRMPQCVLLDLHMPDVSGFEVQAQIAHSHLNIPVVVLTGHDTPEARERALTGGAAAYLCKPIDDETLLAEIGAAIAG